LIHYLLLHYAAFHSKQSIVSLITKYKARHLATVSRVIKGAKHKSATGFGVISDIVTLRRGKIAAKSFNLSHFIRFCGNDATQQQRSTIGITNLNGIDAARIFAFNVETN